MAKPSILKVILSRRMLVAFIMGYAAGLPFNLTSDVLKAWMTDQGIDLSVIGLIALVKLPYSIKFLWAPLLDRFTLPFFGRRKGWLLLFQAALMVSIIGLGATDPGANPWPMAFAAFLVTFFSASQDIVVDAYRREDLADEELGLGSSFYFNGYRIGMLLAGGGGLIIADKVPFSMVYLIMALCLVPGLITTVLTPEPPLPSGTPATLKEAVLDPFVEYFCRPNALWILAFILLYKIGDAMAGNMTIPFYLSLDFTKTEIGTVVKLFGFWAIIGGGLIGGIIIIRLGITKSLWIFGVLQAVSTAGFAVLAQVGYSLPGLSAVIAFENLSAGMGTAAFMAFMASITNKKFTATQ
ncbi:MAG: MFS transporter [Desulfosarcinaceae bacterium]